MGKISEFLCLGLGKKKKKRFVGCFVLFCFSLLLIPVIILYGKF